MKGNAVCVVKATDKRAVVIWIILSIYASFVNMIVILIEIPTLALPDVVNMNFRVVTVSCRICME